MLILLNALLCTKVIRDSDSNLISIIDMIENLNITKTDNNDNFQLQATFDFLAHWMITNQESKRIDQFKLFLEFPDKSEIELIAADMNFGDHTFLRSIIHINGMTIKGQGVYYFLVKLQDDKQYWQTVGKVPLVVSFIAPTQSSG